MTRHADHAAKIIPVARIRSRESGRRGGKDDHLADCRDGQANRQRPRHTQPADTDRKPGTTADHSGDSAGLQAQRPAESERMPYRSIANGRPSIPPCYARLPPRWSAADCSTCWRTPAH